MRKTIILLAAALTGLSASAQQYDSVIFAEDFSGVQFASNGIGSVPQGWTVYSDANTNYGQNAIYGHGWCCTNNALQAGLTVAYSVSNLTGDATCDRWLVTPAITLPEEGVYNLIYTQYASDRNENFVVKLSTTGTAKEDFTCTLVTECPATSGQKSIDLQAYVGQTVHLAFINSTHSTQTDGRYVAIDDVTVAKLPAVAVHNDGIEAEGGELQPVGENVTLLTAIRNTGHDTITSYAIDYLIGNDTTPLHVVKTGLVLPSYSTAHDTLTLTFPTVGDIEITAVIASVNGSEEFASGQTSGTIALTIHDTSLSSKRAVTLVEHFTTGQCQYCPAGHDRLEAAISPVSDRVAWVAHHYGFGSDPWTLTESGTIGSQFHIEGAPMMMIDRNAQYSISSDYPIGNIGTVAQVSQMLQLALDEPAMVTMHLGNINFDPATRVLSIEVEGSLEKSYPEGLNLSVWITEDSLIGTQAQSGGPTIQNYRHDHVLRGIVNGTWGDREAFEGFAAGSAIHHTYTYTVPAGWRIEKCRVIAFVAEDGTGALNRKVLAASKSDYLVAGDQNGIDTAEPAIELRTYPNPATERVCVSSSSTIRSVQITNIMGQTVIESAGMSCDFVEFGVADMPNGVYFVTVRTDKGIATERLIVR